MARSNLRYPKNSWNSMPDILILQIFKYLPVRDLLHAGLVNKSWNRVSYDELLWKRLFSLNLGIDKRVGLAPGKTSWYEEYKRLVHYVPSVCTQAIQIHTNQVLHVSFSHDGSLFATTSKDGFIIVWNASDPVSVKYKLDMKRFSWKYTKFSQFNKSDTLLLVSGEHFGASNSTSGEIAVFTLQGHFELQCRIQNKPYDIFGTWFSDSHLLSGDLRWLSHLESITDLWINKASQEVDSEKIPIMQKLFRFYNRNASSVRRVLIADRHKEKSPSYHRDNSPLIESGSSSAEGSEESDDDDDFSTDSEKILIFITGSLTYTPHQIGLKIIKGFKFPKKLEPGPSIQERQRLLVARAERDLLPYDHPYIIGGEYFDSVDCIDLHGHIIGTALSPDHRYLYVNCRSWPEGCKITNPLDPPPIASEIDIHIIDLETFTQVGPPLRAHRAYTPNNECFFIFLDVSEDYVASGAEDCHAYIWDRHYRVCIAKLPHSDVVNAIALNPRDPSMAVTTSDDFLIKVWRSRNSLGHSALSRLKQRAVSLIPT